MSSSLATVLIIHPGPIYDLEEDFRPRLERLSESFQGAFVSLSEESARMEFGRFHVRAAPFKGAGALRTAARLFGAAHGVIRDQRRAGHAQIDLVVTYDPLKTGLVGWCIARLAGAALVVEVNGDYAAWANYVDMRNPLLRQLKRRIYLAVQRFVLRRADGIKLLYPDQARISIGDQCNSVVRVFAEYTDLNMFRDLGEEPEVLLVGFPFHVKGVDILIEAFKRISPRYPAWHLKILGWYPDLTEFDRQVAGHPQIAHHPPVSRLEVAEHIGRCGVLVLPSRTEAMGRVLLEGMACAKPRIGTSVGGIPTVIENGEDGLLVEPEDVGALAEALDRLLGDPDLRRRMGARGAIRVRREFSVDCYIERTTEFYLSVVARRPRDVKVADGRSARRDGVSE